MIAELLRFSCLMGSKTGDYLSGPKAVKARTKAGNGSLREDNAQEIYYTILN